MNIDLSGKTALVCGSTSGIGLAIAKQFADCGCRVILLARNEEKLNLICQSLLPTNKPHAWFSADFSSVNSVSEIAQKIAQNFEIDILVNNTGGPPAGKASEANTEEFLAAFNNHLINNHQLAKTFIPQMIKNKFGRIINVISTSVKQPLPNLGVSNTIRGAVANWSKTLANELAEHGITVNNILPGATSTDRLDSIIENKSIKMGIDKKEVEKEMLAEIPAKRFGKPEEPAYAACFLASSYANYINGTNIVVDGGRTSSL